MFRLRFVNFLLMAVLFNLLMTRSSSVYQTRISWTKVYVQGLSLEIELPVQAAVEWNYPPGILRIQLPQGQTLFARGYPNPEGESPEAWIARNIKPASYDQVPQDIESLPPSIQPIGEPSDVKVGNHQAKSYAFPGAVYPARWVLTSSGDQIVAFGLFDPFYREYPHADPQSLLDSILSTIVFTTTASVEDRGVQVLDLLASGEDIAKLDIPFFSQRDPRWICDQMGSCNCYMGTCAWLTGLGDAGCFVTSLSMVYSYYSQDEITPKDLDDCLTQNGGYGLWEGCGWGLCAASYQPVEACAPRTLDYQGMAGNFEVLDDDLAHGYPVIAWVDWGRHYVVITGKQDGVYTILDPAFARDWIYPYQIIHFVRYHGVPWQPPAPRPMPEGTPASIHTKTHEFYLPTTMR